MCEKPCSVFISFLSCLIFFGLHLLIGLLHFIILFSSYVVMCMFLAILNVFCHTWSPPQTLLHVVCTLQLNYMPADVLPLPLPIVCGKRSSSCICGDLLTSASLRHHGSSCRTTGLLRASISTRSTSLPIEPTMFESPVLLLVVL